MNVTIISSIFCERMIKLVHDIKLNQTTCQSCLIISVIADFSTSRICFHHSGKKTVCWETGDLLWFSKRLLRKMVSLLFKVKQCNSNNFFSISIMDFLDFCTIEQLIFLSEFSNELKNRLAFSSPFCKSMFMFVYHNTLFLFPVNLFCRNLSALINSDRSVFSDILSYFLWVVDNQPYILLLIVSRRFYKFFWMLIVYSKFLAITFSWQSYLSAIFHF